MAIAKLIGGPLRGNKSHLDPSKPAPGQFDVCSEPDQDGHDEVLFYYVLICVGEDELTYQYAARG